MGIRIALAGNPNAGKTTLFNALTGSNQFVGNWPGVTVEKKEGHMTGHTDVILTDLPGIYSLSPYTLEEVVARNYLVNERPDAILNLVDGTNLERNLYLTTQLVELGIPVVVAINMMDVVRKNGDQIDIPQLAKSLGCKICEISALKETGIQEAAQTAIDAANEHLRMIPRHHFSGAVEHALAHIEEAVLHDAPAEQQRWCAIKLFERDEKVLENLALPSSTRSHIEQDIQEAETELDDDAESIIANERYLFITAVIEKCYERHTPLGNTISDKVDRIVTNRFLALPIFALVMFVMYYVSISTIGAWLTDWTNDTLFGAWIIPGTQTLLTRIHCADWLSHLLVDGIIGGVGSVLGFLPQMLVLFAFLAFLEACGYMSRIAFMMDRIFRKFGLSGKSFIPILIGTGCGVPGILSSRTIENESARRMTIITTTFIPCGAKLPVIALIAGALFGGAWWVAPSAYFIGMLAIIGSGMMLKKTRPFASEPTPFVMELPPYHMPTLRNVLRSMWERGWSFVKKAGTVILISAVVLWFLQNFGVTDGKFGMVEDLNHSVLTAAGSAIAWLFTPLGFGNWESAVATLTGLLAKENIVNTFGVLSGGAQMAKLQTLFSPLAGYSFLVFNLLCAPCFAAMAAIRREMHSAKWTFFAIAYQCLFAYAVSLIVYQLGLLFTGNGTFVGSLIAWLLVLLAVFMLVKKPATIPQSTKPASH